MTGKDPDAANRLGQGPQIEVKESKIGSVPQKLTAAPVGVSVYQFPLKESARWRRSPSVFVKFEANRELIGWD